MKVSQKQLNIALILLYIACMIYAAYTLFQLRDDLVYSSQSLSISDVSAAQPVFIKLNLIVGITLLVGLGILVFMFNNKSEEVIYVEKKTEKKKEGEDEKDEDTADHLSVAFLNDLLKSEKEEQKIFDKALTSICKKLEAGIGVIYTYQAGKDKKELKLKSSFALSLGESQTLSYELGEGLVGQVAKERKELIIDDIPEGYIKVVSGLGSASPTHLMIMPIENDKELIGVMEIASFTPFEKKHKSFVKNAIGKIVEKLGVEPKSKAKASTKKETGTSEKKSSSKGKTKKA